MSPLPSLLARSSVPWPVLVFFVVIALQMAAGLWQHLRRKGNERDTASEPMDLEPFQNPDWRGGGDATPRRQDLGYPNAPRASRIPPPMNDEEIARRLERQLRGGINWRGGPVAVPPPPQLEQEPSPEFAPAPTDRLSSLEESAAALNEAQQRLAHADAVSTAGLPGLQEASAALKNASQRLVHAGDSVQHPRALQSTSARAAEPGSSLPEQLNQTLRDPASARGAVITALLLGRPKALEE